MSRRKRYTEEEKKEFKNKILIALKEGISQNEISRKLGISIQMGSNLKNELISEGKITAEEIEQKKQEMIEKRRQVAKEKKGITSKEELEQMRLYRQGVILRELKNGKTTVEISSQQEIPMTTLKRDISYLIKENKISEDEIVTQHQKNRINMNERNELIFKMRAKGMNIKQISKKLNISASLVSQVANGNYEENLKNSRSGGKKFRKNPGIEKILTGDEKKIYDMLKQGYHYTWIDKTLNLTHEETMAIADKLQKIGALSTMESRLARESKRKKDEEQIIKLLKQGYTQADICRLKPEISNGEMSRIVTRIKNEGRITQEEIDLAQKNDMQSYDELVLIGMKKGFTVKEIIATDEDGYLTESIVRRVKKRLIDEGKISFKKYKKAHDIHEVENRRKDRQETLLKPVKKLMLQGRTPQEIANYFELSRATIYQRQEEIFKTNKKLKENYRKLQIKRKEKFKKARKYFLENVEEYGGKKIKLEFYKLAAEEAKCGNKLDSKIVYAMGRLLIIEPDFLNKERLKLVITEYAKHFTYKEVDEYLAKIEYLYDYTQYGEAIKNFRTYIREKRNLLEQLTL